MDLTGLDLAWTLSTVHLTACMDHSQSPPGNVADPRRLLWALWFHLEYFSLARARLHWHDLNICDFHNVTKMFFFACITILHYGMLNCCNNLVQCLTWACCVMYSCSALAKISTQWTSRGKRIINPAQKRRSKLQILFKCDRIFIYDVLLYVISLMQNRGEGGLKSGPEDSWGLYFVSISFNPSLP